MARWATPDGAIKAAVEWGAIRAQDPRRVRGTAEEADALRHDVSIVWQAIGRLRPRERTIVELYACGHAYRAISERTGISKSTIARAHPAARRAVHHHLVVAGVCAP